MNHANTILSASPGVVYAHLRFWRSVVERVGSLDPDGGARCSPRPHVPSCYLLGVREGEQVVSNPTPWPQAARHPDISTSCNCICQFERCLSYVSDGDTNRAFETRALFSELQSECSARLLQLLAPRLRYCRPRQYVKCTH
jgi:hypothetical protein